MAWSTLYPAKINSPATTVNEVLTSSDTTITVSDSSVLPTGPNIAVIGTGEDAETILYTAISGNDLTGVARGFQSAARAWPSGSQISRLFTAYDFDSLRTNLTDLKDTRCSSLFRQALINGGFDVWQLGETFTNPATASYTADCWKVAFSADGGSFPSSLVHSRQMATDGLNSYRIVSNGAGSSLGANSYYALINHIENGTKKICHGRKVTVSFVASSTISGKKIGFCLGQNYGTTGSPTAEEIINGTNVTLTSSEQLVSYTFTTNTITGKTFGTDVNSPHLKLYIYYQWGASVASRVGASAAETFVGSGNIEIRNVVVNVGEYAFPSESEHDLKVELECMRYFKKKTLSCLCSTVLSFNTGNAAGYGDSFQVPMRIVPIITLFDTVGNINKVSFANNGGNSTTNINPPAIQVEKTGFIWESGGIGTASQGTVFYYYTADARY